jgi:hypothetical protein
MPEEIVPQTANTGLPASEPGENSSANTSSVENSQNPGQTGSVPGEESKLLQELKNTRRRAQLAEQQLERMLNESPNKKEIEIEKKLTNIEPQISDFNDYDQYEKARLEYLVDQRLASERVKSQHESVIKGFDERTNRVIAKRPELRSEFDNFKRIAAQSPNPVFTSILESEYAPEIVEHLNDNPAEVDRLSRLTVTAAVREIGKLEVGFLKTNVQQPKIKSSAPEPITPVPGGTGSDLNNEEDFSQFVARRNREIHGK